MFNCTNNKRYSSWIHCVTLIQNCKQHYSFVQHSRSTLKTLEGGEECICIPRLTIFHMMKVWMKLFDLWVFSQLQECCIFGYNVYSSDLMCFRGLCLCEWQGLWLRGGERCHIVESFSKRHIITFIQTWRFLRSLNNAVTLMFLFGLGQPLK